MQYEITMDLAEPGAADVSARKFQFGKQVSGGLIVGCLAIAINGAHHRFGGKRVRDELAYLYSPGGQAAGPWVHIDLSTEVGRAVADRFHAEIVQELGEAEFDVDIQGS